MAPIATELATLRALTFRITSTATVQLPQHAPAIAACLANCRSLFSSTTASSSKSSSEASVAIHKYRTLLSTLLQDRTVQGRWSAIVLIKATIEIGGWETLQKSLPWVRGLLGILAKPDPPSTKNLCLITLTRIFTLTREYPTLVREVTTPSLPTFIQSSLQIASAKPQTGLLHTVLECFNQLLPRHPTIFRAYQKQLQQLLALTIAPTPSSTLGKEQVQGLKSDVTFEVSHAARRLYVQLPSCAPKGASSEEWGKAMKGVILNVHRVANHIFRAVVEDWQSSLQDLLPANGQTLEYDVQDLQPDAMSLPPWSGIFAGSERLVNLLRLLKEYLDNATSSAISLDVRLVMDLLTRMLSLTVPSSAGVKSLQTIKVNNQVSKEERENLWLVLPNVHVATIELLLALLHRSGPSTSALDSFILDQLVWVFDAENDTPHIRTASYQAVAKILERSAKGLPKPAVDTLSKIVRICCDDLLPGQAAVTKQAAPQSKSNGNTKQGATNADTFLTSSADNEHVIDFSGLREAAYNLLPVVLSKVPAQFLSDSLRTRMDRTAVLIQHQDAMLSSVLNPPPSKRFGKPAASILPLMARSFPEQKDVECLLRPRMPVIRLGAQGEDLDNELEEESEEERIQEDKDDHFVGEELDSLLETAAKNESFTTNAPACDVLQQAALSVEAPSVYANESEEPSAPSPARGVNVSAKRPQHEAIIPPSPTKRVKTSETTISNQASMPVLIAALPKEGPEGLIVIPTARAAPQLAVPTKSAMDKIDQGGNVSDDDDDDDDDVVPLVFGQDTDEDSDG